MTEERVIMIKIETRKEIESETETENETGKGNEIDTEETVQTVVIAVDTKGQDQETRSEKEKRNGLGVETADPEVVITSTLGARKGVAQSRRRGDDLVLEKDTANTSEVVHLTRNTAGKLLLRGISVGK